MSRVLSNEIEDFFEMNRPVLDEFLNSLLERDVDTEAIEVSKYISEGGKRIRGLLMLYFLKLLKGDYEYGIPAAASLELVHSCSLAIDDIIDEDVMRRGRPSAWIAKGLSKTVLVSNLLIPLAIKGVEYLGFDAVKLVVDTWLKVTRGEIADVFETKRTYLEIIALKTSSLFQLSLMLSAIASGRKDLLITFRDYGLYLGYIYQISDDILDIREYFEKSRAKPPFADKMMSWLKIEGEKSDWNTLIEKAKPWLSSFLNRTREIASHAGEAKLSEVMEKLPLFVANKILEEGGLSWEKIISL
ncbi:MAG: polyprenyl synthetase family protein [Fervidicoccaceae archaeon]